MAKATYTETTLYHPFIEGVKHLCHSADEQEAWEEQGWQKDEPDYAETGATVEKVTAPAEAKNATK